MFCYDQWSRNVLCYDCNFLWEIYGECAEKCSAMHSYPSFCNANMAMSVNIPSKSSEWRRSPHDSRCIRVRMSIWFGLLWFSHWEFQDPKMEALYHIRPYFVRIFPYIEAWNLGLIFIELDLDDGKIYRKDLYLMVKPWFPVDFPLNQSIDIYGRYPQSIGSWVMAIDSLKLHHLLTMDLARIW